jgi:methylated-DNA-[protein]-cysteine S-methyltransferase
VAFDTPLGAVGLVESPDGLVGVRVGYHSVPGVARALEESFVGEWKETSWLADEIASYLAGGCVDFSDVALDVRRVGGGAWTAFRAKTTEACRRIPYGEVWSYAELAEAVGAPDAARAVGSVMARNCWPIVVPCHRVLRATGRLGGFSSPRGLAMKADLLALEGVSPVRR